MREVRIAFDRLTAYLLESSKWRRPLSSALKGLINVRHVKFYDIIVSLFQLWVLAGEKLPALLLVSKNFVGTTSIH